MDEGILENNIEGAAEMWNHFCSSFFVGGRKSGDKGKQYDRAGFEENEKTVQPRCARETFYKDQ